MKTLKQSCVCSNTRSNLNVCSQVAHFKCRIGYVVVIWIFNKRETSRCYYSITDSTGLFNLLHRGRTLFATQEIQGYCCSLVASALQAARGLADTAQTAAFPLATILLCAYLIGWLDWDVSSNWFLPQRSPCTCST